MEGYEGVQGGIRRGPRGRRAQYKVYSTVFNLLRPVSHIRHTRVGHRSSEHCTLREAIEVDRATAIATTAAPLPLPHMYVYTSPRTQGSSRQASRTLQPVANTSRQTTARACAASIRPSIQSGPQDRRSAASVRLSGGLASTAATTRRFAVMPTRWSRCCCSPSCCSHHLPPSTPNLRVEHRRVDVSFSSGHKAGSGSKRCLPEVIARCVTAGGHSPRDTLSTLPARRAGRRGFARSGGQGVKSYGE